MSRSFNRGSMQCRVPHAKQHTILELVSHFRSVFVNLFVNWRRAQHQQRRLEWIQLIFLALYLLMFLVRPIFSTTWNMSIFSYSTKYLLSFSYFHFMICLLLVVSKVKGITNFVLSISRYLLEQCYGCAINN